MSKLLFIKGEGNGSDGEVFVPDLFIISSSSSLLVGRKVAKGDIGPDSHLYESVITSGTDSDERIASILFTK